MQKLIQALRDFHLEKNEASLYLAALELGTATAKQIAEKASIKRTQFYDLSQNLLDLGLIEKVSRGRRRYYSAAKPERIIELQKERIEQGKEQLKSLEQLMPMLHALSDNSGADSRIYFYEGRKGIDRIITSSLPYSREIRAVLSPYYLRVEHRRKAAQELKKRISKGAFLRAIGESTPELQRLQARDHLEHRETRLLPPNSMSPAVQICLSGDRFYAVDFEKEFGFVIRSRSMTEAAARIFELLWCQEELFITESPEHKRASVANL